MSVDTYLARLDKTYYAAWVKHTDKRGYVSGNIPVDAIVDVVESYRTLIQSAATRARDLHYHLIEYYGVPDDPTSNYNIRKLILSAIAGGPPAC